MLKDLVEQLIRVVLVPYYFVEKLYIMLSSYHDELSLFHIMSLKSYII